MAEGVPTHEGGHPIEENPQMEMRVCDVCRVVDGDVTPKECFYCGFCKAWICDNCKWHLPKRAKAMTIFASRAVRRIHPDDKDPDKPKDWAVGAR